MPPRVYTRVAVAQIACLPAISLPGRAPFEDPLFDLANVDALRPEGEPPPELDARFTALRERIARVHREQLLLKVQAIVGQCQKWGVRLIVFPEYSLPWQVLEQVAPLGGDLVIVAGTHTVTRPARQSGVYERLGGLPPALGQAVCPVLQRGRLIGLQPKLSLTEFEQELRPGQAWRPIPLEGLPGPMGVLICLDFLHREGEAHRALVADALEQSHFLAVPSYTPFHTLPEFHAKAQEEARRYGRPVLWADVAHVSGKKAAGGSSIFVDEGHVGELRRFPDHAGYLEPGDEGVIVADVDLGFARVGPSTRYDQRRPIVPFAAAGLVYPVRPAGERYAQWLTEMGPLLERDDDEAVEVLAQRLVEARPLLLDAGASNKTREARLRRLARELDTLVSVEQLRRYTREILLPAQALPLPALQAVLAGGAADAIFQWQTDWRGFGLGQLVERLHEASRSVTPPDPGEWTEAGSLALESVRQAVRHEPSSDPEPSTPEPEAEEVHRSLPAGIDPVALGEFRQGDFVFRFRPRPEDFRVIGNDWTEPLAEAAPPPEGQEGVVSEGTLGAAQELFLLTVAEASGPTAAMAVEQEGQLVGAILPVTRVGGHWVVSTWEVDGWWKAHGPRAQRALEEGLSRVEVRSVSIASGTARLEALGARFEKGRDRVEALRAARLASVNGAFVQPTVRVEESSLPALEALDQWLESKNQAALVLGEYGAGKSTTLAEWCVRLWKREGAPHPLLCSLATAATGHDAHGLLLDAAGAEDTPANRAALRLLIRTQRVLPVFDGFDEMATRLGAGGLAGRLSELLGVAENTGRVVVSSREHYFESETTLHSTAAEALRQALGVSSGLTRITFLPFDVGQIRELMEKSLPSPQKVDEALKRIRDTYDLMDLVKRPLLLGMVLESLERISPTARVAPADIYEAYLQHWLSQTSEDAESLSHAQKQEFAEALAEELWRSGRTSCTWVDLRKTVRERMGRQLPDHLTPSAVFRDIEGGAFFVREDEEHYRFAHKSFLEYFLARALAETLEVQAEQALDTRPLTREVAAFLGEVLRRQTGDALQSSAVLALQALLRARGTVRGAVSPAVANAFRLLHGLALWAQDGRQWIPERADLRGADLTGEDLRGARLGGALLERARLAGADLSGADLTGANLSHAVMVGARLESTSLRGANATGADFTQVEATRCDVGGANFSQATLSQSVWLECQWEGTDMGGAEVTAALLAPAPPLAVPWLTPRVLRAGIATGHTDRVRSVSWNVDGRRLASAGTDGTVRLWDVESGRILLSLSGHEDIVWSTAWSADGRQLASAGIDGTVRLWDAETGRELRCLSGHTGAVKSISWGANGQLASAGGDGTVRLWDAESGRALRSLTGHTGGAWSVSWAPDGQRLASAGVDGTVRLWDAEAGRELRSLSGHRDRIWSVSWSADGRRLASAGDDGSVYLWDADSGRKSRVLPGHKAMVFSVSWNADGRRVASAGADGFVRLWDAETGRELFFSGHGIRGSAVSWSADGRRLASAEGDGTVHLWNADSGRELRSFSGHAGGITSVSWNADGRQLVFAAEDGTVRLWDADSGRELRSLSGHTDIPLSVSWSPDGQTLASSETGGTVRLWDAESGRELRAFSGHTRGVSSMFWSPDGRQLASAGIDGTARRWDVESGRELLSLSGDRRGVSSVSWNADGRQLASAEIDGTVCLWDVESGRGLRTIPVHRSRTRFVSWSPDGRRLAASGTDGTVRLLDAESGRKLHSLSGRKGGARFLAWSADGQQLAAAGNDGTVRLWDTESGRELGTLSGHQGLISSVAWSADGRRLASAGEDGLCIWNPSEQRLLAKVEVSGSSSLTSTPGGHCLFNGDPSRYGLSVPRPERPETLLHLPLPQSLREIFHQPDKVKAALKGRPGDERELADALAARCWSGGEPWDGERHHVPETAPKASLSLATAETLPSYPFRPGAALEDDGFMVGREATVHELLALVTGRSPAILLGPRRAGKTWLLEHLSQRLSKAECRVRYESLQGRPPRSADELALLLEPDLATTTPSGASPGAELFRTLGKHAQGHSSQGPRAQAKVSRQVYLLDEVGALARGDETLFPWLRELGQRHASLVLAGSHWDWVQVIHRATEVCPGSSFGNDFTSVVLEPIAHDEARRFLTEAVPGLIPAHVVDWILELCGEWPFYLQAMGHALYFAREAGNLKPFNDKAALAELYDQRLLVGRSAVFEDRLRELPKPVMKLLFSHRERRPEFHALPSEERMLLVETGLCTEAGRWLADRPFFDWLRRRAEALDP